ncbi:Spx/MgsR family RNA polymerase-binding regulatory protein [Olivibacter sp. SDN3]|uniref:Spx/MgsR family RNA polymerase-binding regulatory protein n=1 Tax=Olivibacter sp. SDN3 TaxID=2764720 RepID=UPI00165166E0|nr:Spx/MgsR family RNA polymerase-binding regulatory protein [Olivibacter sp. SDN3]QNL49952.1 Spx/MgsR family RNA polymerase-binding regulatory protein [Olivibacter sp. SDN3]
MKVYGIKNCSTVKKALDWLNDHKIRYEFQDFKKLGVNEDTLKSWEKQVSWEILVNKKGMTWRNLTDEEKLAVVDEDTANKLMKEKTSVIKRPIIESPKGLIIGFDEKEYQNKLK